MKKEVAIWNINSFAECYMQIEEKYKKDYTKALDKFRLERARYVNELSTISGLRIIPSQANYVMAEITNGMTSSELTKVLLKNYNIFIKDLTGKICCDNRQFIRLAVRDKADNDSLVVALREISN